MIKRVFVKNIPRSEIRPTVKRPVSQRVTPMYAKMSRRRERLAQLRARPLVSQKEVAPRELTEKEIYRIDEYNQAVSEYDISKKKYEEDKVQYNVNPEWEIFVIDKYTAGLPRTVVKGGFKSKREADEFQTKHRLDIADRDTPVGHRQTTFSGTLPTAPDKNKYIRKEVMDEYNKQESMRLYAKNVSPFLTDPGYLKDYNPDGSIKKVYKKPVQYTTWDEWRDQSTGPDWEKKDYGSYIPHAIFFDTTGKLQSVVKRKKYQTYEMDYDDRGMDKYGVFDVETLVFGPKGLIKTKTVKDSYESNVKRKDRGDVTDYGIYTSEAWDYGTGQLIEREEPSARVKDRRTVIAPKVYVSSAGLSRAVFSESSGTWIPYGDSPEYKAKLAAQKAQLASMISSGTRFYKSSILMGGFKPSASLLLGKSKDVSGKIGESIVGKISRPTTLELKQSSGKEEVPSEEPSSSVRAASFLDTGSIYGGFYGDSKKQDIVPDVTSQLQLKTSKYTPPGQYKLNLPKIMGGGQQPAFKQSLNLSNIMGNLTKVTKSIKDKI